MLRHPRLVVTTFVVVVTVALGVFVTSDFSVRCVFVNANTLLGARSTGVRATCAPETGHFSYVTVVSVGALELQSSVEV